jgi:hypothetical protein
LDWLPFEDHSEATIERNISINGKEYLVYTSPAPKKNLDRWGVGRCSKLDEYTGFCKIHGRHPFSCDFETIRILRYKTHSWLGNRIFGRWWAYTRAPSGEKRSLCEYHPATEESRQESIRKLKRLKMWVDYFELDTHLDAVIGWAQNIPLNHNKPLLLWPDDDNIVFSISDIGTENESKRIILKQVT